MTEIQRQIMQCNIDIFVTLLTIIVATMFCGFICYLDYRQQKIHEIRKQKRLAQRRKRREGTRWETQS